MGLMAGLQGLPAMMGVVNNLGASWLAGWRGGLMVSALHSGSNGPGSCLGQGTALCS